MASPTLRRLGRKAAGQTTSSRPIIPRRTPSSCSNRLGCRRMSTINQSATMNSVQIRNATPMAARRCISEFQLRNSRNSFSSSFSNRNQRKPLRNWRAYGLSGRPACTRPSRAKHADSLPRTERWNRPGRQYPGASTAMSQKAITRYQTIGHAACRGDTSHRRSGTPRRANGKIRGPTGIAARSEGRQTAAIAMRSCHARTTPDCLPDLSRRDEPGRDRTAAGIRLGQRRTPAPGSAAFLPDTGARRA